MLISTIRIKRKLLIAYYSKTNKQIERTNYTLKAYLRIYLNLKQDNQVLLLPIVQLAYNNKLLELTRKILFFANYRRYLYLFKKTLPSVTTKAALIIVDKLKKIYKKMRERIKKA